MQCPKFSFLKLFSGCVNPIKLTSEGLVKMISGRCPPLGTYFREVSTSRNLFSEDIYYLKLSFGSYVPSKSNFRFRSSTRIYFLELSALPNLFSRGLTLEHFFSIAVYSSKSLAEVFCWFIFQDSSSKQTWFLGMLFSRVVFPPVSILTTYPAPIRILTHYLFPHIKLCAFGFVM